MLPMPPPSGTGSSPFTYSLAGGELPMRVRGDVNRPKPCHSETLQGSGTATRVPGATEHQPSEA